MIKRRVLVACSPKGVAAATEFFGATFELTFVHDLGTAARALKKSRFSAVVGTLQFDESRLFELLPITEAEKVPLVAAKLTSTVLPEAEVRAAFTAAMVAGFRDCIDARKLTQELGKEAAAHECQRRLLQASREPPLGQPGGTISD